ncbi:MFS transporter [Roseimicrobium sp. ORNL1]|uniref:MFS transporter n=1 Tax=Roseimicrobium sp. ORNL1 TaxID=2711231 RepID=UPI0013E0EEC0|nr:MFS transporter [Roseimicrobium sp. ORNL1]QIF03546.1 MFS transporter [Roseimicrobium sp. ORNL1]
MSSFPPDPEIQPRPVLSERFLLLLLATVQFTHIMDFMVMMPLGPQLMRIFKIEPHQFSLLVASYTFSAGIAGLIGAFWVDRFDRKQAMLFCYAGFILGTLACALAPSYHALLAARVLSGAFGGVSGAIVLTVVGDVVPLERRAGAMGIVMASFAFAAVAGVPVGLWCAAKWSWHAPFIIIVGVGTLLWITCLMIFPSLRGHLNAGGHVRGEALARLRELVTNANTLTALLFMTLLILGHFMIIPFLSPSLVSNVGLQESDLPSIYLVGGFASLCTSPVVGRLADKHGRLLMFSVTIAGALVPIYFITNQGITPMFWVLVLSALFFIFAGGRFVPGQAIITSAVPARLRGSFMSLNSSVRDMVAGLASLLGGHIIAKDAITGKILHFPTLGWIAIGASLLSVFVASRVKPVS